ncbi:MAG: S1 RNA-binding domain-containing protein [Planctomycetia bacterium]|nr:S1 RNA-binding domain-containing protein [Planctomycetia bacterium]
MSNSQKNVVTPLKKEPVQLFGTSIPGKVIAKEKPPTPAPPPVATPVKVAEPVAPPPAIAETPKPVVAAKPSVSAKPIRVVDNTIRKFADLNRRQQILDDEVEAELAQALGEMSADGLYAADSVSTRTSGPGGNKKGKVLSIHGDDVFVDIGGRSQGVVPFESFATEPKVGDEIEVVIKGFDGANGCMLLALPGAAERVVDWSSVARGMIVEARVTGTNKGGLSVEVNQIRGFLPISQLEMFRVDDTTPYVNQRLRCMVTEVDPAEKNLVVSRRALLEQERAEAQQKLWEELAEGQKRTAIVGNIKEFGAFVDLGGCDALLPTPEMSWQRVDDPAKFVTPGQRLEVKVIRLDKERRKVTVSLRECMSSPWDEMENNFPVGSIVNGKVVKIMDFGAFVELAPGIEGLLHISELASKRVYRVTDAVKQDQHVEVKVIKYDPATRRLSLSLKAVQKEREDAAQATAEESAAQSEAEADAAPRKPIHRRTDLKGGLK